MWVGGIDSVDFFGLAGAEVLPRIEAPDAFEEALAAQDFVKAGDAATEAMGGIEEGGIAAGDLDGRAELVGRDGMIPFCDLMAAL